jgi:hypothetical protein
MSCGGKEYHKSVKSIVALANILGFLASPSRAYAEPPSPYDPPIPPTISNSDYIRDLEMIQIDPSIAGHFSFHDLDSIDVLPSALASTISSSKEAYYVCPNSNINQAVIVERDKVRKTDMYQELLSDVASEISPNIDEKTNLYRNKLLTAQVIAKSIFNQKIYNQHFLKEGIKYSESELSSRIEKKELVCFDLAIIMKLLLEEFEIESVVMSYFPKQQDNKAQESLYRIPHSVVIVNTAQFIDTNSLVKSNLWVVDPTLGGVVNLSLEYFLDVLNLYNRQTQPIDIYFDGNRELSNAIVTRISGKK